MLKIITAPNPILSQTTKPALRIDARIRGFIEEMGKTLLSAKDPEGVGLAAPQVGKSLSLFIAKPTRKSPISVFINPKIAQGVADSDGTRGVTRDRGLAGAESLVSDNEHQRGDERQDPEQKHTKLEGCLSLPNIWGEVKRQPQITVSYLDEKGKLHEKLFKGFMATIIQHETDHLQGILFPKRVLEQKGKLYKSKKNKKGEDIFEEIEL